MSLAVWVPLFLPLLAAPLARRLADRCTPRAAALLLAGTAGALAAGTVVSLGLLALAGLLRLPFVAGLAHLAPHWLPAASAVPAGAAVLALIAVTALVSGAARRQYADLARARRTLHTATADGPLALLHDERADAYALPGRPGRIVVTTGMLDALPAAERAALLAHEHAHLAGRHHLFLALGEYAAAVHPALRGLRPALGFHLERWADESAAHAVGDRALTARAVGRAALAAARAPGAPRPRLAAGAHGGPVPRRVAALLAPPTARRGPGRTAAALLLSCCLATTAATALEATTDLHQAVETAQAATGR
ncbi:M56 family metallopeptidase [Kitasatospora paranensis]